MLKGKHVRLRYTLDGIVVKQTWRSWSPLIEEGFRKVACELSKEFPNDIYEVDVKEFTGDEVTYE